MVTIATALGFALVILSFAITFQINKRRQRTKRIKTLELKPNCLLTRYPIAFIEGQKSVFRLFDHWNIVPQFLREHGYEVIVLEPAAKKNSSERVESILKALDEMPQKCHLIGDSSCEPELRLIASRKNPKVASLTMILNTTQMRKPSKSSVISINDLKPLDMALETYEIRISPEDNQSSKWGWNWADQLSMILLRAHNILCLMKRRQPIDPLETAEIGTSQCWIWESRFLDLAISLAERDLQWSD